MTVAPFVPNDWRAQFPEFATLSDGLAMGYFNRAQLLLDNTDSSVVPADPTTFFPRQMILYLITAHIARLSAPNANGGQGGALAGRIANAAEGTVNVATEVEGQLASRAYWSQTSYGLEVWQALQPYLSGFYVPPQRSPFPLAGAPFRVI